MTDRKAFTPEEWRTLAQTPVEVMYGVVIVSNGGLRRELKTIRRTLRQTDEFEPESELVTHVAGFVRVNADRVRRDAETHDFTRAVAIARAHDYSREAAGIVRARATAAERAEYAQFVRWCAERVADAGVEGGLLGLGGRRISPAEREFIDAIGETLAIADGERETSE
ncbi:hypothetical protein [Haloferax denitrificans]|uniref:Uncharacterized protein n=1 Tax=Haloferax denitrificans ATCC 35960 TaxID=662478 RepID=M0JEJ1_9EURY|nr:hypothetical protein [Haloferax denitrificans]EMA07547.1 hypothetical protein C438_04147 [Haloferax denitrificans ATCC 35960]